MLAIRNFGHFWSREHVNWGSPVWGKKSSLEGYIHKNRKPYVVDFREQIGIYVLFTQSREVVYVGQTGSGNQRLGVRLRHHTQNDLRDRWQYFSWFGFRQANANGNKLSDYQKPDSKSGGSNSSALNEIEAILIQLFEPRLNKQGPKWGADTIEFLQYIPSEWEKEKPKLSNEDLLKTITKQIKRVSKHSNQY
jgi:hypothetical protein